MNRRQVLVAAGAAFLAGCNSTGDGAGEQDQTPTDSQAVQSATSTRSATRTQTPTTAGEFEVTAPRQRAHEYPGAWPLRFTVRNVGDDGAEFPMTLQRQDPDGNWVDVQRFEVGLSEGEQAEIEESIREPPEPGEWTYRFEGTGVHWTTRFYRPANYEVTLDTVPEQVELGDPLRVTVSITNTGGIERERELFVGAQSVPDDSSNMAAGTTLTVSLAPEETMSRMVTIGAFQYVGTVRITVDDTETERTVSVTRRTLPLGEPWTLPTDISFAATDLRLTTSYEYQSGEDTYTRTAPDGAQFAIIGLRAENTTAQPVRAPSPEDVFVLVSGEQYARENQVPPGDTYEGGEVLGGAVLEGQLVYEIPASASRSDVSSAWTEQFRAGTSALSWQP